MPNESQRLEIVVQFKQYVNDRLVGYKNVVAATYEIFNISDDKPKFVIRRLSDIATIESSSQEDTTVIVKAQQYDGSVEESPIHYIVELEKNVDLDSAVSCYVSYQSNALNIENVEPSQYVSKIADGTLLMVFDNSHVAQELVFSTREGFSEKYKNKKLKVSILDIQSFDQHEIQKDDGYICLS